jgi:hypothetical protein
MFVAHYAANNEYREFGTFDEAKKWLADAWEDDGNDIGFSDETMRGQDYIATITHVSKFVETDNKEKLGYKYNEEAGCSANDDGEEWPYAEDIDSIGNIVLVKKRGEG